MKKAIVNVLMAMMISTPTMALDTRDRPLVLPSPISPSNDGGSGCSKWTKVDCQKDWSTCTITCREICTEGPLRGNQRPYSGKIPGCSTKNRAQ